MLTCCDFRSKAGAAIFEAPRIEEALRLNKYPARQRAIVAALRSVREEAGLSQRALSEKLKEPSTYIHLIEALRRDIPVAEFIQIAKVLGIEPAELIRRIR